MDFQKIDEQHDIIEEFVDKIVERCHVVFKNRGEEMAKRILYLHETEYAEEDVELSKLYREMKAFEQEANKENPYLGMIDENS